MRMRKLVHELMEPSFKSSTEDRSLVKKLQRVLEEQDKRVNTLEIVLFQKDEDERLGLLDNVYKKITDNESNRLMEEEKLREEITYIKTEVDNVIFTQRNIDRALKN